MISSRRITESLRRAAGLDWSHGLLAGGVAIAAALTAHAGLAVARSGPAERVEQARRIAEMTGGDITLIGFQRLSAGLDPAALQLALRHDPAAAIALLSGGRAADEARLLEFQPVGAGEAQRINSAIPFAFGAVVPAAPLFLRARSPAERDRAVRCLATAVYYEAALEPDEGQRAVAQVVLNRLRDPNYPKSVCGVVYEGWERHTGCQFSFTCDGALARRPMAILWERARKVAEAALSGHVQKDVGTATHYHADYVAPYWAPGLNKITQIGAHIFYRWPGAAGELAAFNAAYRGGELALSEAVLSGRAPRAARSDAMEISADQAELGVRAVTLTDPATGETRTRMQATLGPKTWGRRKATPEDIARINALLEARFPTKPAEAEAPAAAAPPEPTPLAAVETASASS
jgi:spore germination cell wall hydrolase CwlJ-like protein